MLGTLPFVEIFTLCELPFVRFLNFCHPDYHCQIDTLYHILKDWGQRIMMKN